MHTVTLTVANEEDYQLLLLLAQRLGLPLDEVNTETTPLLTASANVNNSQRSREELIAIIQKGASGTSIPDPLAWQREQRQDHDLPFHILKGSVGNK